MQTILGLTVLGRLLLPFPQLLSSLKILTPPMLQHCFNMLKNYLALLTPTEESTQMQFLMLESFTRKLVRFRIIKAKYFYLAKVQLL